MKRKTNLMNVKGSYDYGPNEQRIRNYIQDTLKNIFESYGYKPLETPILCYYDLLAGKYDESNDILNEIYKLTDQGDRHLGLRYDLTVPFAKYIALEKDLRLPFKRYEIGKVFRDGPVKPGRDREFMQCDVDVVGLSGHLIEAELISIWVRGYNALGIEIYIKYNSRNLLRGLIKGLGITLDSQITEVITVIDKMDKISKDELLEYLEELGLSKIQSEKLLDYLNKDLKELTDTFKNTNDEELSTGLRELNELKTSLEEIGLKDYVVFSPSLARGQDYYTGNVFEVYAKNGELSCSLGGGGRYDKMITDFISDGCVYPAVGVSFGLSTIYEILKNRDEFKNYPLADILIIPIGTENQSLKIANTLRDMGYKVELTNKKVKKGLEYASRENIPYICVIGEDELRASILTIKNLSTKEESKVSLNSLSDIKNVIKK